MAIFIFYFLKTLFCKSPVCVHDPQVLCTFLVAVFNVRVGSPPFTRTCLEFRRKVYCENDVFANGSTTPARRQIVGGFCGVTRRAPGVDYRCRGREDSARKISDANGRWEFCERVFALGFAIIYLRFQWNNNKTI